MSEAATVDGLNKAHPPAATAQFSSTADEALPDELLPTTDFVIADEPGADERPLWAEENASGEHALDAFPSKSARASAPWRSPEEMLLGAPTPRAEADEPLDDPLNPSDNSAVSWDVAPVYPPSHTDGSDGSATDSKMSVAATPVPAFGFRWLGMVAMTFLLFAIGMSFAASRRPGHVSRRLFQNSDASTGDTVRQSRFVRPDRKGDGHRWCGPRPRGSARNL